MIHSHNYSLAICFRRYFDSVYSLTALFPRHGVGTTASMGVGYLVREIGYMARHFPLWLPYYALYTAAKIGGGDVTYEPKGADKVLFAHDYHVNLKGQKCSNCHYKTFQMKSGESAYKMDMSMLTKGQFCGSCHDGKKAFDVKDANSCKRCHKE